MAIRGKCWCMAAAIAAGVVGLAGCGEERPSAAVAQAPATPPPASTERVWTLLEATDPDPAALASALGEGEPRAFRSATYTRGDGRGASFNGRPIPVSASMMAPNLRALDAHLATLSPEKRRDSLMAIENLFAGVADSLIAYEHDDGGMLPACQSAILMRAWALDQLAKMDNLPPGYDAAGLRDRCTSIARSLKPNVRIP